MNHTCDSLCYQTEISNTSEGMAYSRDFLRRWFAVGGKDTKIFLSRNPAKRN